MSAKDSVSHATRVEIQVVSFIFNGSLIILGWGDTYCKLPSEQWEGEPTDSSQNDHVSKPRGAGRGGESQELQTEAAPHSHLCSVLLFSLNILKCQFCWACHSEQIPNAAHFLSQHKTMHAAKSSISVPWIPKWHPPPLYSGSPEDTKMTGFYQILSSFYTWMKCGKRESVGFCCARSHQ